MDHPTYGPVPKVRVRDAIADRIRDMIRTSQIKPGDQLPPERELAKSFSVSRSVVREAISILESTGVVRVEHGHGIIVTDWANEAIAGLTVQTLVREAHRIEQVLELRKILEVEAAGLAAERASAEDIRNLEQILQSMEEVIASGGSAPDWDYEFHFHIAKATRNEAIVKVFSAISDLYRHTLALHRVKTWTLPGRGLMVLDEHRKMLEAIRTRQAAAARAATLAHLLSVENALGPVLKQQKGREGDGP